SKALHRRSPRDYRLLASPDPGSPTWVPDDLPVVRIPGVRRAVHLSWTLVHRPRVDRFVPGADLLHVLVPTQPVPSSMPVVYTFHDVMPLHFPDWYSSKELVLFRAAVRDAAARAAHIIAVSNTVAEALTDLVGIDRSRITVVYEGIDERFRTPPSSDLVAGVCASYGVEAGRYFLYVGAVSTRKNVRLLVECIANRGPGTRLLIVGAEGHGAERVTEAITRLGVGDSVTMTGHIADEHLMPLMSGACALLHPSRYEGFGFTPLEAMALGTPAIAARAGALPEVLGDGAMLLDGEDVTAWADVMTRIEQDPAFARELAERGRQRALTFTWERAAIGTEVVYSTALGHH
ncbi:MAG TPA: glycosyltransferase family 1 protein, partial [Actinomycetota bacterium]|nr:glycosyltransferase family 1 protein [Actinomycetota bacterium]